MADLAACGPDQLSAAPSREDRPTALAMLSWIHGAGRLPAPRTIPLRGGHVSLIRAKVAGMLLRATASAGVELTDELAVVRTGVEPRTPAMQDA